MRRISLFQTLALTMSTIVCIVCILLGSLFSATYYFFADQELKAALQDLSMQLTRDYLVVDAGGIKYAEQPSQVTVSELLRSKDISAAVLDSHIQPVTTFGIYRFAFEKDNVAQLAEINTGLQHSITSGKPVFSHLTTSDALYEVYTVPLTNGSEIVGYIQLAKQSSFIARLNQLNLTMMLITIPPLVIIVWLLVYWIVKKFFKPLLSLITVFATVSTETLPHQLTTKSRFSELHQLVEACNTMINRLKSGIENQKYFSAFASHELRTPLTRAITQLEVLSRIEARNREDKDIENIIGQIEETNQILDSLLLLLQPMKLQVAEGASLAEVYKQVIESLSPQLLEKKITVLVDGNLSQQLAINRNHLAMIMSNLLSNAIKYSTNESTVRLAIIDKIQGIELSVADAGRGISGKDQSAIFQPFFRSNQETAVQGIGIGLAVVKRLCVVYGLKIELKSELNKGSIFTIKGLHVVRAVLVKNPVH